MLTGQYDVFISHAGPQKDFALWVRSHIRTCGYMAFVDEPDLRCGPASTLACVACTALLLLYRTIHNNICRRSAARFHKPPHVLQVRRTCASRHGTGPPGCQRRARHHDTQFPPQQALPGGAPVGM